MRHASWVIFAILIALGACSRPASERTAQKRPHLSSDELCLTPAKREELIARDRQGKITNAELRDLVTHYMTCTDNIDRDFAIAKPYIDELILRGDKNAELYISGYKEYVERRKNTGTGAPFPRPVQNSPG